MVEEVSLKNRLVFCDLYWLYCKEKLQFILSVESKVLFLNKLVVRDGNNKNLQAICSVSANLQKLNIYHS